MLQVRNDVPRGILLIDHGSRREEANRQLHQVAARLAQHLGPRAIVEPAHMELAEPSIASGLARCVQRGSSHVVAIPCMLSRGRHVTEDIPRLLAEAALAHPGLVYAVSAPLSEHPAFLDLLSQIAQAGAP